MVEEADKSRTPGKNPEIYTADQKEEGGGTVKKQHRGILSRIWNGIFRVHGNEDFEKALQHISKAEASLLLRVKNRSRSWPRMAKYIIIFSIIFEVTAVGYAIMTTSSLDLNWKRRAFRVLPMFLLPVVSSLIYSTLSRFTRMCDRKDQKTLEKLRSERRAKIDELKERTNFYITQQLIQRYDPDPAAKAAAATVLASKLGADSGLKVYVGDETMLNTPSGKSSGPELMQTNGLRNRKQSQIRYTSAGSTVMHRSIDETTQDFGVDGAESASQNQVLVAEHHLRSTAQDGGWIARLAALLVGEDPTQCYALICANCHAHNGLARKEDFPYISYYCPHCHALNRSRQLEENPSMFTSTDTDTHLSCPTTSNKVDAISSACGSALDSKLTSSNIIADVERKMSGE